MPPWFWCGRDCPKHLDFFLHPASNSFHCSVGQNVFGNSGGSGRLVGNGETDLGHLCDGKNGFLGNFLARGGAPIWDIFLRTK